jgi:hypothetical protein
MSGESSDVKDLEKGKVLVPINYEAAIENFFYGFKGYVKIGKLKYPVIIDGERRILRFDQDFIKKQRLNGESRFKKEYKLIERDGMDCIEFND